MNLKPQDSKLIAYLYSDARAPTTKIAKTLKLSREQVKYKINKFELGCVIKGYIPLISYSRLGYHIISLILIKSKSPSKTPEIKKALSKNKNRFTTVETLTNYDLGALFAFKNEKERNEHLSDLLEKHYKQKEYSLDKKEVKILKELNKDAKTRIIDISNSTGISAELIVHKLKKLKKEKVLLGTRAYFDMKKTGFFYSFLLLNLQNFSKQNQEKLRNFAKNNPNIDSLMFLFGKPNCYMQMFHKSTEEIHETIKDLKEQFSKESLDIQIIPLKNEGEDVNTLPFL